MSTPHNRRRALVKVIGAVTLSTVVPNLSATLAGAATSLCQKVSVSEVSSTLGLKVTKVSPVLNGNVTVCWYKVGANPDAVFVRIQTHDTAAGYAYDKKMAAKEGEKPVTDKHFTPYAAFSTAVGAPSYGYTYSVTILKKSSELSIGGAGAKLTKVEALAKKVLPLV